MKIVLKILILSLLILSVSQAGAKDIALLELASGENEKYPDERDVVVEFGNEHKGKTFVSYWKNIAKSSMAMPNWTTVNFKVESTRLVRPVGKRPLKIGGKDYSLQSGKIVKGADGKMYSVLNVFPNGKMQLREIKSISVNYNSQKEKYESKVTFAGRGLKSEALSHESLKVVSDNFVKAISTQQSCYMDECRRVHPDAPEALKEYAKCSAGRAFQCRKCELKTTPKLIVKFSDKTGLISDGVRNYRLEDKTRPIKSLSPRRSLCPIERIDEERVDDSGSSA